MADSFVGADGLRAFVGLVADQDPGWPRAQLFLTNAIIEVGQPVDGEPRTAIYEAYAARIHRLPSHQRSNSTLFWSGELLARLVLPPDERWRIAELRLAPWEPDAERRPR